MRHPPGSTLLVQVPVWGTMLKTTGQHKLGRRCLIASPTFSAQLFSEQVWEAGCPLWVMRVDFSMSVARPPQSPKANGRRSTAAAGAVWCIRIRRGDRGRPGITPNDSWMILAGLTACQRPLCPTSGGISAWQRNDAVCHDSAYKTRKATQTKKFSSSHFSC